MHVDIYVYVGKWGMAGHKRKTEVTLVNYPKKSLTNWQFGSSLAQNYTSFYLMSGSKDIFKTL